MANTAAARNRCGFQWDIYNPFLPLRSMEASFYHGSSFATKWKVTLQPVDHRSINHRKFSCSLKLDEDDEIVALGVKIRILFNDFTIADKEESNYSFCARNRRTYYFTASAVTIPSLVAHRLVVLIEISFRNSLWNFIENIFNQKSLFFYNDDDLRWLSRDLRRLFTDSPFSDMTLWSSDRQRSFRVHSHLIEARWDNFFREHSSDANNRHNVETDISHALLSDILKYMYSGTVDTAGPERATPSYTAELFQVIDRHKLHHLYKVFAKSDSDQLRETTNDQSFHSRTFQLDGSNDFHSWRIDARPKYEFVLRLKICTDEDDPWISYLLDSKSRIGVSAQVNLELLTTVRQRNRAVARPRNRYLHERVCDVGPGGTFLSEIIRFQMEHRVLRGTEIRHSIRCILSFSDGTTVMRVGHTSDNTLQDDRERFEVLKDHMTALLANVAERDWSKCDFEILCNAEGEADAVLLPLHKGIVSVRMPAWRNVFEDIPGGKDMSISGKDLMGCTLGPDAFKPVLQYIYTGRIFNILPFRWFDEIEHFSERAQFDSLRNFVNRMRLAWQNRISR